MRLKRTRDEYDAADRTHDLLAGLQLAGVPGEKLHYLCENSLKHQMYHTDNST